ncbi:phytoene desaturase family protein [Tumebacillus flagellatus]|uniref:Amine oxidase domain-containing protein n=1 Tax=Tumebacillus flagellatus TaxID=1157490 RepID=A0A074LNQ1_9BACL|nr:NAD(P)/FAD-dependent oxidoreductase [Tumebacillus flagellatus]KEO82724.1 hypothetical protein EL26_14255 [Tumebacillus flagellatus]
MSKELDVIVIGAGLGGLTTAALLAKQGANVLVLERHYVVGGCASTFRRHRCVFDAAVHLIGGLEPGGFTHRILQELDVLDRLPLVEVSPMYRVQIGSDHYDIPADLDEFARSLSAWFPDEAAAIEETMMEIKDLGTGVFFPKQLSLQRLRRMPEVNRTTVQSYLHGRFRNPRIPFLITSLFPYIGVTPDEMETLTFMAVLASYHGGAYYIEGSTQKLADALAYAVERDGGRVKLRTEVEQILIEDGRAVGVRTKRGEEFRASTVVSNADMRTTFTRMIAPSDLPSHLHREVHRMIPSHSALLLYAALRNDGWTQQLPHELIVYPHENFSRDCNSFNPLEPVPGSWFVLTCPSKSDPSLAPEGTAVVSIMMGCEADFVEQLRETRGKDFLTDAALQAIEHHLPGLRERVTFLETATPRTITRYTGNSDGAIYGWKRSACQPFSRSAKGTTAIPGLFAAGHWTTAGHGVFGTMRSARLAAKAIQKSWRTT